MFTHAVFQGGGVKGIGLVGALKRVEEAGHRFTAVGGTSAGSIVAALYAAGYTADEMKDVMDRTPFESLLDPRPFPKVNFFRHRGLYKGRRLYQWVYELLEKKNVRKFEDKMPARLRIVASDLTRRELTFFDAARTPTMYIAEAVRISASIPLFFEPYLLGTSLMVDGGILSNYPLRLFEPSQCVGFKIVSPNPEAPTAPEGWRAYMLALVDTMMAAHDKQTEHAAGHSQTILIDSGDVKTTQFSLTDAQKSKLWTNGYQAATEFLATHDPTKDPGGRCLEITAPRADSFRLQMPDGLDPKEMIRVSVSGLFRIYVDGKYLLIKGNRIDQYQPVGGVFKRLGKSTSELSRLGVRDDDKHPIDDESRDDLRVRVPLESLPAFLEWYRAGRGRETTPEREFREELIESGLVAGAPFKYLHYEWVRSHVEGIQRSHRFDCWEVLIAEIYEVNLSDAQAAALRATQARTPPELLWCKEALVRAHGHDAELRKEVARISSSSGWLLDGVGAGQPART